MQEKLNEFDKEAYQQAGAHELGASLNKIAEVNKQYLLNKNNILEKLKETVLFPYLLEMEYLVGYYEGIQLTDSPNETLKYFPGRGGVTEISGISMDVNTIISWNVFRYKRPIKTQFGLEYFTCYLFLKITTSVQYFLFSFYKDKVYNQEITLTYLDKQPEIRNIRELMNDTIEEEEKED